MGNEQQIDLKENIVNNNLSETDSKNDEQHIQDSDVDSDIATYQSVVYGNNQIVLAKKMDDDLDDYTFGFETKREHKVWHDPHDRDAKVIKADSSKEDKKRQKIKKSNEEIRKLKIKRKLSNANDLKQRNRSRSSGQFKNAHERNVKFKGTAQLKQQEKMDKIKKQREEIRRIKEQRKLEKEGKVKAKNTTHSFAHAHDRY